MKYIHKQPDQPECITSFIQQQMDARREAPHESFPVDYGSFNKRQDLTAILIQEQGGICAYTGVGIDSRLQRRQPRTLRPPRTDYWFTPHIEHLKAQAQCRAELEAQGKTYGIDPGEDMDYRNMVAALQVSGTEDEHFGAVAHGSSSLPVLPIQPDCEAQFTFDIDGNIIGASQKAETAIDLLRLRHKTLSDWRRAVLEVFLDKDVIRSRTDLEDLIQKLDHPPDGMQVEFSFVIKNVVMNILAST